MSKLDSFPAEIFDNILYYLDLKNCFRIRSTCRVFKTHVEFHMIHRTYIKEESWRFIRYIFDNKKKPFLIPIKNKIKHLNLKNNRLMSENEFCSVLNFCPHLEFINIENCDYTLFNTHFKNSVNPLHNLKVFIIDNVKYIRNNLLEYISACSKLEKLSISSCHFITDTGFNCLSKGCPNIKILSFSETSRITENGLSNFINKSNNNLEELYFNHFTCLSSLVFENISAECPNLRVLEMEGYRGPTVFLKTVLESCRFLEKLNFNGLQGLEDESFNVLGNKLTNIKEIYISFSRITNTGAKYIGYNFPNIEKIDLTRCLLSDLGFSSIALQCPRIKVLILTFTLLSDTGLHSISLGCKNLRVIHLDNTKTTDMGIYFLTKHCEFLQEITLNKHHTDKSLVCLGRHSRFLKKLYSGNSISLTDVGINYISRGCKNLKKLSLSMNRGITNKSLVSISNRCPSLNLINLENCPSISKDGLEEIISKLPNLKYLCIQNTPVGYDYEYVNTLKEKFKDLYLY